MKHTLFMQKHKKRSFFTCLLYHIDNSSSGDNYRIRPQISAKTNNSFPTHIINNMYYK